MHDQHMAPNDSKLHQTTARTARRTEHVGRRAAAVTALAVLVVTSAHLVAAVLAPVLTGPHRLPEDLDAAVGVLAAVGAAAVLATWTCGGVLTAAALAFRAAGRTSATLDALSAALTPHLLRRLLAAALGAAALGGVAGPSLAAPASAPVSAPVSAPEVSLTWPGSPTATGPAPAPEPPPSPHEVVVRRGDTLWGLAARSLPGSAGPADVAAAWPRWYRANRAVIGDDPDLLHPGQLLVAPQDAA